MPAGPTILVSANSNCSRTIGSGAIAWIGLRACQFQASIANKLHRIDPSVWVRRKAASVSEAGTSLLSAGPAASAENGEICMLS